MNATLEQISESALKLSTKDRAALTRALLQSLEEEPADDPAEVEQAWHDEVTRRVEEIKSGRVKGVPAEEVFAQLRAKYG
jgi:putative addiction module component (TIGR02574 family)